MVRGAAGFAITELSSSQVIVPHVECYGGRIDRCCLRAAARLHEKPASDSCLSTPFFLRGFDRTTALADRLSRKRRVSFLLRPAQDQVHRVLCVPVRFSWLRPSKAVVACPTPRILHFSATLPCGVPVDTTLRGRTSLLFSTLTWFRTNEERFDTVQEERSTAPIEIFAPYR